MTPGSDASLRRHAAQIHSPEPILWEAQFASQLHYDAAFWKPHPSNRARRKTTLSRYCMAALTNRSDNGYPTSGRRKERRRVVSRSATRESVFVLSTNSMDIPHGEALSPGRDERARGRRSRNASSQRATSSEAPEAEGNDSPSGAVSEIKVPATIPNSTMLEHIATSRFFHHYVCPDRTFFRLGLDFTSFIIHNATMRGLLAEIVVALGILTLPRKSEASYMAARLRYVRALRLTNRALKDNVEAKTDEVLMAVILLSFFETTPNDEHSIASWTAHLDGARMLLRMRGRELLQRQPTYRMFSMLRQQIVRTANGRPPRFAIFPADRLQLLNCLMTMQPVPQDLIDLSTQLSETQDEDEKAGSDVVLLFARLCNLFASSRNAKYGERDDVLAQAQTLDDDLMSWSLTLPVSHQFYRMEETAPSETFGGYYEIYDSLFSAEVWSLYRCARLGVNGIIVEQRSMANLENSEIFQVEDTPQPEEGQEAPGSPELDVPFAVLESLRNDVCAGTPFMLGRFGPNAGQATTDIPLCKRTPAVHYLMFILQTVGITKEMSDWANSQIADLRTDKEVENGAVWNSKHMVPTT